uniref:RGS domain-containing protein n=1 Tax=Syphacia muris TaxID=451379 RepID=A0A0N5AXV8_9BILA
MEEEEILLFQVDSQLVKSAEAEVDNAKKSGMNVPSTSLSQPTVLCRYNSGFGSNYDSLDKVLANKILSRKFCGFLKKQKCKESLDFYLATVEYRRVDPKERKAMARKIYDMYLDKSTNSGINITASNLKEIEAQLDEPGVGIFDSAAREVAAMLSHDKAIQFSARLRAGEDFTAETVGVDCCVENDHPGVSSITGPFYVLVTEAETENILLSDPLQSVGQAAEAAAKRFLQKVSNHQGYSRDPRDYEFVDEEGNTPDPARQALDELSGRTLRLVEISRFVAQVYRKQGEIRTHIIRARKCLNLSTALRPVEERYNLPCSSVVCISGRRLHGRFAVSELDRRAVAIFEPGLDINFEKLIANGETARHKAESILDKKLPYVQHREIGIYEIPLTPHRTRHMYSQAPRKSLLRRFGRH